MAKVNRTVRRIAQKRRRLPAKGLPRDLHRSQVVIETIHDATSKNKSQKGLSHTLKKLERQTKPSKAYAKYVDFVTRVRFRFGAFSRNSKISRIKKAFGFDGGKLGVLVIKPEMFGESNKIRKKLQSLGFDVVKVKDIVFDKKLIHKIYGDEFGKGYDFQIQAINLMNGPTKVLVFKHLPRAELYSRSIFLKVLKRENPKKYAELIRKLNQMSIPEVFSELYKGSFSSPKKGSMRQEFVYPQFERFKSEGRGHLDSSLDAFGYFKKKRGIGEISYQFSGIHSISSVRELFTVTDALFTNREIKELASKL